MTERPYIWHVSKFLEPGQVYHGDHPWTVTLGRPKNAADFKPGHAAPTLEAAMAKAISLVPKEVP